MIVKKVWINRRAGRRYEGKHIQTQGWYLFGIIPLYIIENEPLLK